MSSQIVVPPLKEALLEKQRYPNRIHRISSLSHTKRESKESDSSLYGKKLEDNYDSHSKKYVCRNHSRLKHSRSHDFLHYSKHKRERRRLLLFFFIENSK